MIRKLLFDVVWDAKKMTASFQFILFGTRTMLAICHWCTATISLYISWYVSHPELFHCLTSTGWQYYLWPSSREAQQQHKHPASFSLLLEDFFSFKKSKQDAVLNNLEKKDAALHAINPRCLPAHFVILSHNNHTRVGSCCHKLWTWSI